MPSSRVHAHPRVLRTTGHFQQSRFLIQVDGSLNTYARERWVFFFVIDRELVLVSCLDAINPLFFGRNILPRVEA